jgi:hypothetical protein
VHIWARCTASHQWSRVLLWVGLLLLWLLLALATNVGVTGGFTHDLVAIATPGPTEARQVTYPSAVVFTISVVDGPTIYCQTTSDRISGDIMVKLADLQTVFGDLGCKSHMEP